MILPIPDTILFNPNDEARLSTFFGLGSWTLPVIISVGLVLLAWNASRRLALSWKDHALCYLNASLSVSLVVVLNRLLF